jgi:hypothetical protein
VDRLASSLPHLSPPCHSTLLPLEDYPENWQVATVNFNATSLPLLSALKFVGRWALEEHNPWLHHRFGNRETCLRRLRISYRKPMHQLIRRYIEKVYFAAGPKLLRSRPIVFAFLLCPEAEIEDYIRSRNSSDRLALQV